MKSKLLVWLLIGAGSMATACQSSNAIGGPDGNSSATSGPDLISTSHPHSAQEDLLRTFEVQIDPTTLHSSVALLPRRVGAQQSDLTDIDLLAFGEADDVHTSKGLFVIRWIERNSEGDIKVTFRHSHPFPRPKIVAFGSGSVSNRADLGYTGRLLILADLDSGDVAGHTFFPGDPTTGDIIANTEAILDPDGYLFPFATEGGVMIAGPSTWATEFGAMNTNTWPYKLLADDGIMNGASFAGNRFLTTSPSTAIPNGNVVEGNYDVANDGWTENNIDLGGSVFAGWTGFDYIHGGQTVENSFTISNTWATTGTPILIFRVAVVVKLCDPKQSSMNKLPTALGTGNDRDQFAYRLPYAALDCSQIVVNPSSDLTADLGGADTATLLFSVRDWDANATVSAGTFVEVSPAGGADDTDPVNEVPAKDEGIPAYRFSIPDLGIDDSGSDIGLTDPGGGGPADVPFTNGSGDVIANANGGLSIGTYPGLIRVQDPEGVFLIDGTPGDDSDRHFGVDGANPSDTAGGAVASDTFAMRLETYQAFHIKVIGDCDDTLPGSISWDSELSASANTGTRGQLVDITRIPSTVSSPFGDLYLVAYRDTNTSGSPNPKGIHVAVFDLSGMGGTLAFVSDTLVGSDNVSWLQIAAAGTDSRGVLLTARDIGSGDLIGYTFNYTSSPAWHALATPIDSGDVIGEHDLVHKNATGEDMYIAYQTIEGLKVVSLDPNYASPGSPTITQEAIPAGMAGPGGGESPKLIFMDASGNDGAFLVCARDSNLNELQFGRESATFASIVASDPSGPPHGLEPSMGRSSTNVPMITYRAGSSIAGSIFFINGTTAPDGTTSDPTWDTMNGPYVIAASDASTSFLHPRLCMIDARPGIICARKDTPSSASGDHDVVLFRSCAEAALTSDPWTTFVVSDTVTNNVGGYLAAIADSNQFVFAAYDDTGEDPVILRSTGSN